jgi:hypothetical protein
VNTKVVFVSTAPVVDRISADNSRAKSVLGAEEPQPMQRERTVVGLAVVVKYLGSEPFGEVEQCDSFVRLEMNLMRQWVT